MMFSEEVKLYQIVGPQGQVMYVDTQAFHVQVRSTHGVNLGVCEIDMRIFT
jgi:hypothetical protein